MLTMSPSTQEMPSEWVPSAGPSGKSASTMARKSVQDVLKLDLNKAGALPSKELLNLMIPTLDELLEVKISNSAYSCDNCESVLLRPVGLTCGHTYCDKCYRALLKAKEKQCSSCGSVLPSCFLREGKISLVIASIVEKAWPKHLEAAEHRILGNDRFTIGKMVEALREYKSAEQIVSCDPLLLSNMSAVYLKLGDVTKGLKKATECQRLRPHWAKTYYRLGAAHEADGALKEAFRNYLLCRVFELKSSSLCGFGNTTSDYWEDKLCDLLQRILPEDLPKEQNKKCAEELWGECLSMADKIQGMESIQCFSLPDSSNFDSADMDCPICQRLLHCPVVTPCGHVFCKPCLGRSLDHDSRCPMCKASLARFLAVRAHTNANLFLTSVVEGLFPKKAEERAKAHAEEELQHILSPKETPIFICTIAFPFLPCPLHIFEPRYRLMVRRCLESGSRQFGMCLPSADGAGGIAQYGTMLEVRDIQYFPDGRFLVDTIGIKRFRVLSTGQRDGYCTGSVDNLTDELPTPEELENLKVLAPDVYRRAKEWCTGSLPYPAKRRIEANFGPMPEYDSTFVGDHGPSWLWWLVAVLPLDHSTQVVVLGLTSLLERMRAVDRVLRRMG
ncbi:unnamed protein product [Cyprideis torosa]|uniref:Uncharacterized protein n=1 Tax=Cyprideis torosa TaxID=163714 RepID=A0A7R8W504_9CRUS|nr:unnamed protein product [Cyprideis torosa]CAG0880381.1 unnamed protein product [Cyprideis torosa]